MSGLLAATRIRFLQKSSHSFVHPLAGRFSASKAIGNLNTYHSEKCQQIVPRSKLQVRPIHTSRPRKDCHSFLVEMLKNPTSLEVTQTGVRIALSFFPLALFHRGMFRHFVRMGGNQQFAKFIWKGGFKDGTYYRRKLRCLHIFITLIILAPVTMLVVVTCASHERTPVTGRWRLIMFSSRDERAILQELQGEGWYQAVYRILSSSNGAPRLIPNGDPRYALVQRTLQKLQVAVEAMQHDGFCQPSRSQDGGSGPPSPSYPLVPRESFLPDPKSQVLSHPNPPYHFVIVDDPNRADAFAYGFGPGGSGVVVYSGALDTILSSSVPGPSTSSEISRVGVKSSQGGLLASTANPVGQYTEGQQSELAMLLAHEISHLALCHHLESLSLDHVARPFCTKIMCDIFRTLLYPVTLFTGPHIMDGLRGLAVVGERTFREKDENYHQRVMEQEADVVSLRLLHHAGFDASLAVQSLQGRLSKSIDDHHRPLLEDQPVLMDVGGDFIPRFQVNHGDYTTCCEDATRLRRLQTELARWEA